MNIQSKIKKVVCIVDKEQIDSVKLLNTKINCAEGALQTIPQFASEQEKRFYIQSVLDSLGNYRWLLQDFWDSIYNKYGIDGNVNLNLDYNTGEIFLYE